MDNLKLLEGQFLTLVRPQYTDSKKEIIKVMKISTFFVMNIDIWQFSQNCIYQFVLNKFVFLLLLTWEHGLKHV